MEIRKIRRVKCKWCGKEFTTLNRAQKYCSKEHSYKFRQKKCRLKRKQDERDRTPNEQPCWTCTKACCGCSWSKNFTPIEGWKVKKRTISTARKIEPKIETYQILYCPEYEKEIRK